MEILVSCEWLDLHRSDDGLVILDTSAHLPAAGRDPRIEFAESHIEGARFLGLSDLKDEMSDVPAALPRTDQFEAKMRSLGVRQSDSVVLYDDSPLRSSARAFFIFSLFGFTNVAILDGGLARWKELGLPTAKGRFDIAASDYTVTAEDRGRVRSKKDMLGNCDTGTEQVVDARDAGRFTGEVDDAVHGLAGGHIPGARNLPFGRLFRDNGTYKDADALREIFSVARLDLNSPITGSCGSGMTASVVLFALQLLGVTGALYDGSWSEWGADLETPKELGAPAPL